MIFVNSQFGIFNLMQAFFTLLNIPVVVPIAFGLLFRQVPKWSAIGSIVWGLLVGVTTRYLLGWDIGPQVYLSFAMTFGIFTLSSGSANGTRKREFSLVLVCSGVTILTFMLFNATFSVEPESWQRVLAAASSLTLGGSLYIFAGRFAAETHEERAMVEEFFKKLDTPIDVAKEVFGAGRKQVSTFPLVGGTTIVMGLLMSLIFFTDLPPGGIVIMTAIVTIMIVFGTLMWYFGKKSEIKSVAEYENK